MVKWSNKWWPWKRLRSPVDLAGLKLDTPAYQNPVEVGIGATGKGITTTIRRG